METNQLEYNFREGEILLVDKPLTWTSFDVVKKIRYPLSKFYKVKRFKVGHAGTLDPLATGLLVICTGKKTKEITGLIAEDKEYTGVIQLGSTTPSYDLETEIDQTFPVDHITTDLIQNIIPDFTGEIIQMPPIFSAKKVNGQRAYDIARKGGEVELKQNKITIHNLELELVDNHQIKFKVSCSKGTYIRSLAFDIGSALNSGAHLIELRRNRSGDFDVKNAKSIDEWNTIIQKFIQQ